MKVSPPYAEEHFADLLNAASGGEEVEIARPDGPTCRLTLVPAGPRKAKGPRILGAGVGEMLVPSWEWKATDKELEREVNEAPLV
jgi:antitoxin (DNA-binding transcriptional repressor) of toxin-antitoxin stability system